MTWPSEPSGTTDIVGSDTFAMLATVLIVAFQYIDSPPPTTEDV